MDTDVNIDAGRTRALGKALAPGGAAAVATAAVVGALAIMTVGLGLYWSNEPQPFDVRDNAARFAERQGRPVVVGTATTATLVGVAETLLDLSLIHIYRPASAPRRSGCRVPGRRAGCAARSRPGSQ